MQVVVLAGGLGTRLRPLTETTPKPMVEVRGRPFLDYIIRHLLAQNFRDILMLVGYRADQIQRHFGDGRLYGATIQYVAEAEPLGTGGALRHALDALAEAFLVLYGDSYLPIDYRLLARTFHEGGCLGMVVAHRNGDGSTGVTNNVAIDEDGWVTRYDKNAAAGELDYVEAGVLAFRRRAFEPLPPGQIISLEREVFPRLIQDRELRAFVTTQRFYDIGTPERLERFALARQ